MDSFTIRTPLILLTREQRAALAAIKAADAVVAMTDHQAGIVFRDNNTAKLRALRLARDAEIIMPVAVPKAKAKRKVRRAPLRR